MDKQRIDIDLITRYHNGELDGKAMQQLEERALEDPFLAEAMEGFGEFSIDKDDIIDLNERLNERIKIKQIKPATDFRNWYFAASIIILIGFISIYLNLPEENNVLNEVPLTAKTKDLEKESPSEKLTYDTISSTEVIIEESPVVVSLAKPETDANEILASSDQVILEPAKITMLTADSAGKENLIASYSRKSIQDFTANNLTTASRNLMTVGKNNIVKGKVLDFDDKEPLTGASVLNTSTGIATTTDFNGEFQLVAEPAEKLSIHNLGYLKKESEIEASDKDSLKFYLKRDNASLSEVAVIGYGSVSKKQNAGPKDGWLAFKEYLHENNELETNETGTVVVEFVINSTGEISDLRILKSLSKLADARAIYLIRNYPSWQGASDGSANKAKVTIRFK